jgi:hypothetical protein
MFLGIIFLRFNQKIPTDSWQEPLNPRTHIPLFSLSGLIILALGGCATKQDVRPLYDAAIQNFQAAQKLENDLNEVSVNARVDQIKKLLSEMERLAIDQMEILVLTRWDQKERDFKAAQREDSWHALLGIDSDAKITPADVSWSVGALDKHLSKVFWTAQDSPITAYDILIKPGGIDGFTKPLAPDPAIKEEFSKAYAAWRADYRENILGKMAAVLQVKAARQSLLDSLATERTQRKERIEHVYSSLIKITSSARDYAGTLTDNVQIISLANSLLNLANGALSTATGQKGAKTTAVNYQ